MARGRRPQEIDPDIAVGFSDAEFKRGMSTAQCLAAFVRTKIVNGKLTPGTALPEAGMAKAFGISRSPVREAMRLLSADRLMNIVPQHGNFVAELSIAGIVEGAFIRTSLEQGNIRDLAEIITREQLCAIDENIAEQENAVAQGNKILFHTLDESLHRLFFDGTGRIAVWNYIQPAKIHTDRARTMTLGLGVAAEQALADHKLIVQALADRNPDHAIKHMRTHLARIVKLVEDLSQVSPKYVKTDQDAVAMDLLRKQFLET